MIANISYFVIGAAIFLGCLATAIYCRRRMDIRARSMKSDFQQELEGLTNATKQSTTELRERFDAQRQVITEQRKQLATQSDTVSELVAERERAAITVADLVNRVDTIVASTPEHDANLLKQTLAEVQTELRPTLAQLNTNAQQLTALNTSSTESVEEIKRLQRQLSQLRAFAEAANSNANDTAAQIGHLRRDIESNLTTERLGDVEQLAIVAANMAGDGLAMLQVNAPSSISPMLHGHSMMMYQMLMDASSNQIPSAEKGFHLLEIGTTREKWWSQMSTSRLAATCRTLNYRMITVDVDKQNTASGLSANRFYDNTVSAETALGEEFVAQWEGNLPPYIYIDAYDYEHEHHSDDRQTRYVELQGEGISNEACWAMHYKCAVEFVAKCPDNGIVVFDDVFMEDGEWLGKGKTAAPYMLENGFEVIAQNPQTAVFRKRPVE